MFVVANNWEQDRASEVDDSDFVLIMDIVMIKTLYISEQ